MDQPASAPTSAPVIEQAAALPRGAEAAALPSAEGRDALFPVAPNEFVTAISHFYRGELARMASWRDRLDRTTNWAVGGAAAMLSISLSAPSAHHGVIILAMLLVLLLLGIEARRYRFYDIYRRRVRTIERNYYGPLFGGREAGSEQPWVVALQRDLTQPRFYVGFLQAMARRLWRNYIWIFFILLVAWLLKITLTVVTYIMSALSFEHAVTTAVENSSIGPVSGPLVIAALGVFYLSLLVVMFRYRNLDDEFRDSSAFL